MGFEKKEQTNDIFEKRLTGQFSEKIEGSDPIIFLGHEHIRAGLIAFTNANQTSAESFDKYRNMLRMAEAFIGSKYDFDFENYRKEQRDLAKAEKRSISEEQLMIREITKLSELMESGRRKVEITVRFEKPKYPENKEEETIEPKSEPKTE